MPFAEAVERAGSFEASRPHLRGARILAQHEGLYSFPDGEAAGEPGKIPPDWWEEARVDPSTGRVIFKKEELRVVIRKFFVPEGDQVGFVRPEREMFALGIVLERTAVETLFPAPAARTPRHAGGRDADHNWLGAAGHVDRSVTAHGPLPRHNDGRPIITRAVQLMTEWFEKNDPPAPQERSIRRWISKNPRNWWGPN